MNLLRMLAYVTGMINQALLLQNEYLVAENRILKGQVKGRLLLSEAEKATLAEIATGWDARSWRKWRPRRNLIRFWAGIGSSSRTSLMDRGFAGESVDQESMRKSNVWSCRWPKRIQVGAMIALLARWRI